MAPGVSPAATPYAPDTATPASWSLLIEAYVAGAHDSLAYLGVRTDATPDYDTQYDIPRPPAPPGTSIQVYFPHDGGNWPTMLGNKFAVDYTLPQDPSWRMMVETNAGNGAVTLQWDTTLIGPLPGSYFLLMEDSAADSLIYLRETDSYTFTYTGTRTFFIRSEFASSFIETETGWNILSVPRIVADYSAATLFPDGISAAFDFDSAYHPRDTMSNGMGYWMKFASPHLTTMTGLSVDTLEIPVRAGWNMIGTLSQAIPAPVSPDIVSVFYEYSAGYHRADSLLPGKGYWVKVASDGILPLGMAAPKTPARGNPPAETPSVTIHSSDGGSATLHFIPGKSGYYPQEFDIPPVPPAPAFDARFSGGGAAVLLAADATPVQEFIVEIQSDAASISLAGDRGASSLEFVAETGPDRWTAITGTSEPVAFTKDPGRIFIKLRVVASTRQPSAVPDAFIVVGSYPNPFNPSTVIEYQLPGEAVVTLRVVDPGGRTVFLGGPVSEGPGQHRFTFDAGESGLAGGIYFFTVSGEGVGTGRRFSGSGKMIFLK